MTTLETILQNNFECKQPFLTHIETSEDGTKQPFTDEGAKAYGKLINVLYAVGELLDFDVNEYIEQLDDIANSDG